MQTRALTMEDVGAVLSVLNAVEEADRLPLRTPVDELVDELTDESLDLARDSLGLFDDDGACLGYGWVQLNATASPQARWATVHVAVHPDHTGRGLGRRLLTHVTARGEELLAEVEPDPPRMLTSFVHERQAAAMHLLADAGFEPIRYMDELTVDLSAVSPPDPARQLPAGITVRPWDPTRSAEAKGVHRGAFADHWGSSPISEQRWQRLIAPPRFAADLATIAVRRSPDGDPERDALVGMVLVTLWPEDWPVTGREEAWIDVVAVARGVRGTGVASAMLRRTLAQARARGLTHATLGVDTDNPTGAHRLYTDLGFVPTNRMQRWARPLVGWG